MYDPPDIVTIGPATRLVKLSFASRVMGITSKRMRWCLWRLKIPIVEVEGEGYFLLYAFEKVVFSKCLPGNPDWELLEAGVNGVEVNAVMRELEAATKVYSSASEAALRARIGTLGDHLKKTIEADAKAGINPQTAPRPREPVKTRVRRNYWRKRRRSLQYVEE
jgi:hypothetical protein